MRHASVLSALPPAPATATYSTKVVPPTKPYAQLTVGVPRETFTNERRVVRTWREEKTADGRIIKVPVEVEVDANGRPVETK